jgi:hypothetical protein
MIRLSYRDIDKEFQLSPEEMNLKGSLLDSISTSSIDEAWSSFIHEVNSEVESAVDSYVDSIVKKSPQYQKVADLDAQWSKLSPEQQAGEAGSKLSDLGAEADNELDEYKRGIESGLSKVKNAMIAQLIEWKM